jgi:hypothetical protein
MKAPSDYHEISIELPPLLVSRLKENSLGKRTLAEEAIRMIRYALRQMFPPCNLDEWRNVVGKEDWKELLHSFPFTGKRNINQNMLLDQPYKMVLEVPSDMMDRIEEVAKFKQINTPEAVLYTIEYALTEVFSPRTPEEVNKELRETWRGIFRAIWNRSQ